MWRRFRGLERWKRRYIASLIVSTAVLAMTVLNVSILGGYIDNRLVVAVLAATFAAMVWLERGASEAFAEENPHLKRWLVDTETPWWNEGGPILVPVWAVWLWRFVFGPRNLKTE